MLPLGKIEPWIACNMHRQSESSVNVVTVIRLLTIDTIPCVTKVTVMETFSQLSKCYNLIIMHFYNYKMAAMNIFFSLF